MRFALRIGADPICEKPLVLNPWNVDALQEMEQENGNRVNAILQLRLHPAIKALEQVMENASPGEGAIDFTCVTSRGQWYLISWRGDISKSGDIATNIGAYFFDMLQWVFGKTQWNVVYLSQSARIAGFIELEMASMRWFLSIGEEDFPKSAMEAGKKPFRTTTIDRKEIEFSDGLTNLHTLS